MTHGDRPDFACRENKLPAFDALARVMLKFNDAARCIAREHHDRHAQEQLFLLMRSVEEAKIFTIIACDSASGGIVIVIHSLSLDAQSTITTL